MLVVLRLSLATAALSMVVERWRSVSMLLCDLDVGIYRLVLGLVLLVNYGNL